MLSTLSLNNIEFVKYSLELRQLKRVTSLSYEAVWTGGWLQTDSGVRGARAFVSLVLYWRWLQGSFSCGKVDWCTAQAIISSITLMQGGIPLTYRNDNWTTGFSAQHSQLLWFSLVTQVDVIVSYVCILCVWKGFWKKEDGKGKECWLCLSICTTLVSQGGHLCQCLLTALQIREYTCWLHSEKRVL